MNQHHRLRFGEVTPRYHQAELSDFGVRRPSAPLWFSATLVPRQSVRYGVCSSPRVYPLLPFTWSERP